MTEEPSDEVQATEPATDEQLSDLKRIWGYSSRHSGENVVFQIIARIDAAEALNASLLARCSAAERFLVAALTQVDEFRRECDPAESKVLVTHEEMYGPEGVIDVLDALTTDAWEHGE